MKDEAAWMMLFSGIVAFKSHPSNKVPLSEVDLAACAHLADRAMTYFLARKATFDLLEED